MRPSQCYRHSNDAIRHASKRCFLHEKLEKDLPLPYRSPTQRMSPHGEMATSQGCHSFCCLLHAEAMSTPEIAFRFGIIADPQYADADDHHNFKKTAVRYYRGSLDIVNEAVTHWNAVSDPPLSLMLQLGDIIDGKAQHNGGSEPCLQTVLAALDQCACKNWYHAIGNHELYNFSLDELDAKLGTRRESAFERETSAAAATLAPKEFYDWCPHEGWRFVMLHPFEQNIIEKPRKGPRYEAAIERLRQNNPNNVLDLDADWAAGLRGAQKRFVPFNGAMGSEQIAWLRRVLDHARARDEMVVVCSHLPFFRPASQVHTRSQAWLPPCRLS